MASRALPAAAFALLSPLSSSPIPPFFETVAKARLWSNPATCVFVFAFVFVFVWPVRLYENHDIRFRLRVNPNNTHKQSYTMLNTIIILPDE
jgi:hypothetical protein